MEFFDVSNKYVQGWNLYFPIQNLLKKILNIIIARHYTIWIWLMIAQYNLIILKNYSKLKLIMYITCIAYIRRTVKDSKHNGGRWDEIRV